MILRTSSARTVEIPLQLLFGGVVFPRKWRLVVGLARLAPRRRGGKKLGYLHYKVIYRMDHKLFPSLYWRSLRFFTLSSLLTFLFLICVFLESSVVILNDG